MRSGRDPSTVLRNHYEDINLVTCGPIELEVLSSIKARPIREKLAQRFSIMQYVATDQHLWGEAIALGQKLARAGTMIKPMDIIIAAAAIHASAAVHTYDKHFSFVPGLRVISKTL
ncbi:MAG: PIN domain-containing protein [Verrucomicrobiota bacterium]